MSRDPVRLFDEGGAELVHALLLAAREEQPEAAALNRTLAAVGVGVALATSGVATSATVGGLGGGTIGMAKGAAVSTVAVLKWLAVGFFSGLVVSSAGYGVNAALAPVHAALRTVSATPVASLLGRAQPAPARVEDVPLSPPLAMSQASAPHQVPATPVAQRPERQSELPLSAEVAALDAARRAIRAGDARQALRTLGSYEARFPDPRMLPEALYLELEALSVVGDTAGAELIARRILRSYPSSPQAARARAVLATEK